MLDNTDLGHFLPEFTYHATVMYPDGGIVAQEATINRDAAFDAAAEAREKEGCAVEVVMIERDAKTGRVLNVSDVTPLLLDERGIDASASVCPSCERESCNCDEAYDIAKEEAA